jgi:hypothetical protein
MGFDNNEKFWISFNTPTNYVSLGAWKYAASPHDNVNVDAYDVNGVLLKRITWVNGAGNHQFSLSASGIKYLVGYATNNFSNSAYFTNLSFSDYADTVVTLQGFLDVAGVLTLNTANASLSGNGTVNGNVDNSAGTVSPGASTGNITIVNNFTQSGSGTLKMELAQGGQDLLVVNGAANLGGILEISLLDGFLPADGQIFKIMEYASYSGTFSRVTGLMFGGGYFDLEYKSKELNVVAHVTSVISGIIHDAATSAPLAGVDVAVGMQTVQTDSVGAYSFTVTPGSYTVVASRNGYESQSASVTTVGGQISTQNFTLKPLFSVTVTFSGSGKGSVSDAAAGLSCGSTCQNPFAWNTPLNLTAKALPYSLFTGWSGAGCSGTADCAFTVLAPTTVEANFDFDAAHSVRALGPPQVFYPSLQSAFDAASGVVQAWGVTFAETLLLNRSVAITLRGGYDAYYGGPGGVGVTMLQGKLTIEKGTLVVDGIAIR